MAFETTKIETGVRIDKYLGQDEVVIIPDKVDGLDVIQIVENLFSENETIKELAFPTHLRVIPKGICWKCINLETIILPKNLEIIGESAFDNCSALKMELRFPKTLKKIGAFAFRKCERLFGDLIIPRNVIHIGIYSFNGCSGLDGYLIYNEDAISKIPVICDRVSSQGKMTDGFQFVGTNLLKTKLVDDISLEEEMGQILKRFIKEVVVRD